MSYTTPDFGDDIIGMLAADGYTVHEGDPEGDGGHGFWFSWAAPGMSSYESGPTKNSELAAWASAMRHRIENSSIPLSMGSVEPADTITCTLTYTDQACYGLMCTAAEGGIRYWADIVGRKLHKVPGSLVQDYTSFEAEVQDGPIQCDHPDIEAAEIDRFTIDASLIRTGIRRLLAPGAQISPAIRNDVALLGIDGEHAPDADSADAIVQFAVFGELVFG